MHIAIAPLCPMSLSARLIQLRRERDWTQQDVADQGGLHVNPIKRDEAGVVHILAASDREAAWALGFRSGRRVVAHGMSIVLLALPAVLRALARWGLGSLYLSAAVGVAMVGALMMLRATPEDADPDAR
jgi:hypothetical protein